MTHSRRRIVELLDEYGLRPSRALGQNFVADAGTVRRIARLADVGHGDHVVEIGGGLGSLTLALSETGARVTVIEIDKRVLPVLRAIVADRDVDVRAEDALQVDWATVIPSGTTATVVANLPYNVGATIVARLLDDVPQVDRMLVMLQKEVAERLVANVGDKEYGALSVKVRYHAEPKMRGAVSPSVFVPQPNVDSALVELRRLPVPSVDPAVVTPEDLFMVVRSGFAQRRKMLRRSLAGVVTARAFECAEIDPTARAEQLDVIAWGRLAACRNA